MRACPHGRRGRFRSRRPGSGRGAFAIFLDMATEIGSGYQWAGKITAAFDGGNHPVSGDVLRCRSCGGLLLPDDQAVHEGFHSLIDGLFRNP